MDQIVERLTRSKFKKLNKRCSKKGFKITCKTYEQFADISFKTMVSIPNYKRIPNATS